MLAGPGAWPEREWLEGGGGADKLGAGRGGPGVRELGGLDWDAAGSEAGLTRAASPPWLSAASPPRPAQAAPASLPRPRHARAAQCRGVSGRHRGGPQLSSWGSCLRRQDAPVPGGGVGTGGGKGRRREGALVNSGPGFDLCRSAWSLDGSSLRSRNPPLLHLWELSLSQTSAPSRWSRRESTRGTLWGVSGSPRYRLHMSGHISQVLWATCP